MCAVIDCEGWCGGSECQRRRNVLKYFPTRLLSSAASHTSTKSFFFPSPSLHWNAYVWSPVAVVDVVIFSLFFIFTFRLHIRHILLALCERTPDKVVPAGKCGLWQIVFVYERRTRERKLKKWETKLIVLDHRLDSLNVKNLASALQ